jgi:tartrate-resistant acid phosphatase type 5
MRSTVFFLFTLVLNQTIYAQDFNIIAVGDTGKGNEAQYQVGAQMAQTCKDIDCQFALLLGDNFYEVGVTSVDDPQFIDKFEKPYADFPTPFYVALGNHDYGEQANDWKRGDYQVQYSQINPKWILPSHYYSFTKNDVLFIVLDTSRLFHNKDTKAQTEFVKQTIKNNTKKWIVVVSHHPYISNGKHGNAGSYDGVPFPPYSGSVIKKLFEKEICPYVDLVVSGHEHSLQTLPGTAKCPKPIFVVSGTGAKPSENLRDRNPFLFQKAVLGFTTLKFTDSKIEINHMNVNGETEHTHAIIK